MKKTANEPLHWLTKHSHTAFVALVMITIALSIGVIGYHALGHLSWVDALLEASMILGGMGPVSPMTNDAVKIFASIYALCSGLALISITGILLAPWVNRMIYHTHRQAAADARLNDD